MKEKYKIEIEALKTINRTLDEKNQTLGENILEFEKFKTDSAEMKEKMEALKVTNRQFHFRRQVSRHILVKKGKN